MPRLSLETRTIGETLEGEVKVGFRGSGVGGKITETSAVDTSLSTPLKLIQKTRKPLLLVLDEAQRLGTKGGVPEAHQPEVQELLKCLHNGEAGKPVILLAGGLGMTFQAFQALGISRMAEGCKFNMEPLEEKEERDVIKDWLKKRRGGEGGHDRLGECDLSGGALLAPAHSFLLHMCRTFTQAKRGRDDRGGAAYRHGEGASKAQTIL